MNTPHDNHDWFLIPVLFLLAGFSSAATAALGVDGDGCSDALIDGIMIIR